MPTCHELQDWKELLPRTKLKAHSRHIFRDQVVAIGPATHVRFNIYPDGGVSRLRAFRPARAAGASQRNRAAQSTSRSGSSQAPSWIAAVPAKWANEMLALRPFASERSSARRSRSDLGRSRAGGLARGIPSPSPDRRQESRKKAVGRRRAAGLRGEQSRAQQASDETRAQLAEANQAYHAKFGTRLSDLRDGQISGRNSRKRARAPRRTIRTPNAASPPKNSARSRACAWRNSSHREPPMSQITTHVLDVSLGRPAAGVPVILEIKKARRRMAGTQPRRHRRRRPPAPLAGARCACPGHLSADVRNCLVFRIAQSQRASIPRSPSSLRSAMPRSITTSRCS